MNSIGLILQYLVMDENLSLSIIVPLYNSLTLLVRNYERIIQSCDELNLQRYEIIFINDGSEDNFSEFFRNIKKNNIKFYEFERNHGLGRVLQYGFEKSSFEKIVYMDIDLSYGIENLKEMISLSKENEVILCSKYLNSKNEIPFLRKFYRNLFHHFIKTLSGVKVSDVGSGLVLFNANLLKNEEFISNGFAIHYEIFLKLIKKSSSIKELPINYSFEKGTPSFRKHFLPTLKETLIVYFKN